MIQNTTGPWFAFQENKEKRFQIVNEIAHDYLRGVPHSATRQMKFIADVRGPDWPGVSQGPETAANAHLMAAAPEMYYALKGLIYALGNPTMGSMYEINRHLPDAVAIVTKIEKALEPWATVGEKSEQIKADAHGE